MICAMRAAKAAKDLQGAASDLSDRLGRVFQDEVRSFGEGIGSQLSGETKGWFCEYLEQKALPLLRAVVRGLCAEHPQSPSAFVALMLVDELLGSAGPLASDLRKSLSRTKPCEPEPDPQPDMLEAQPGGSDLPAALPNAAASVATAPAAVPPPARADDSSAVATAGASAVVAADPSAVAAADPSAIAAAAPAIAADPSAVATADASAVEVSAAAASDTGQAAAAGDSEVGVLMPLSPEPRPPDAPKPRKSAPRRVTLMGVEQTISAADPIEETPADVAESPAGPRKIKLGPDLEVKLPEPAVSETPLAGSDNSVAASPPQSSGSMKKEGTSEKQRMKRAYTVKQKSKPLSTEQLLPHLKQVPNMTSLTEQELERVASICQIRDYDQDEIIMSYGQSCDELHIIVSGTGELSVPQTVGALNPGSFFGQEALQASSVKTTAQLMAAGGPVSTICIPRARFNEISVQKMGKIKKKSVKGNKKDADGGGLKCSLTKKSVEEGMCSITGHKLDPLYQKTAADRDLIQLALEKNRLLSEVIGLSDEQLTMVSEGVHLVEVKADAEVITAGDVGNALYIVHEGVVKVVGPDVLLRAGDAFGELALMYDEPRSATITATRDSTLWVLPRNTFKEVTQVSAKRRLAEYSAMLWQVPAIRDNIAEKLLGMLAAALEENEFIEDDEICIEDEDEGMLFLVFEGTCMCEEEVNGETVESCFNRGDWIGEDQLMMQLPADKTVRVTSESATVLALHHSHFELVQNASKDEAMLNSANDLVELQDLSRKRKKRQKSTMTSAVRRRASLGASTASAVGADKIGTQVDLQKCEITGVLGEGSFGLVLHLKNSTPDAKDSEYALKIISKEHLQEAQQESMVQNERNVMTMLDSNFITRMHNTYVDSNFVYFLLESVLGGELFDVYTEHDFWGDLEKARFYTACVALGLAHLHSKRVIWRDLKLENCLLNSKGYLKLADMGIAKHVLGKTYTVCGTVDYFAPEQLKQVGYNRGADWWALGILVFIMVAGHSPFDAPEVSQVYRDIIKGFSKVTFPSVFSAEAEECVRQLCRKKPQERVTMQRGGISNLMQLPFFDGLDWEALVELRTPAPWVPPAPDFEKISNRKPQHLKFETDLKDLKEWNPEDESAAVTPAAAAVAVVAAASASTVAADDAASAVAAAES